MTLTWKNLLAIVFVAVVLFLLAAVPAAEAPKEFGFTAVDDSTELIAGKVPDVACGMVETQGHERLPESPGGVIAKVTNSFKVTDNAKEVPFGGAAGLAAFGIRGPTTS